MSYVRNRPTTIATVPALQNQVRELLLERAAHRQTIDALSKQVRALGAVPADRRKPEAVCGTHSGYARHIRLRETPCYPCKAARAEYQREYRKRNAA